MTTPKSDRSIIDVRVGKLVGRLYDEYGRCNTTSSPLQVSVQPIVPGRLWNIHVSFTSGVGSYVDILLDADVIGDASRAGRLFATGLLYGDEANSLIQDEHGMPFCDSDNRPIRRASVVVKGPFEGARLDESDWAPRIRVDCSDLLTFWIDVAITFIYE